jgi:tetratricopeptide (TPR) repeat protein
MQLESYFTDISINFSTSKENRPELKEKIEAYAAYAESQVTKYQSYRLNLIGFNIITLTYQILNEHEKLMASCERAIRYFDSLEHDLASAANFRYILRMLPSQIMLGNYERAKELAHQALSLTDANNYNYLRVLEFYLILGFYSRRYDIALKASEMVHAIPNFKDFPDSVQEYWKIYDGFIYLFIQLGKIKVPEGAVPRQFKVARFLNEVPTYSKDKRGANVTILILQVLILLQQKKYDKIIDKADALKVYTSRYLRKNETYRSNCFIKMLLLLPHYAFNKKGVLRRSAKLEKRLSEVPIAEITPSIEVEVVPYETLWEIVKELLQD